MRNYILHAMSWNCAYSFSYIKETLKRVLEWMLCFLRKATGARLIQKTFTSRIFCIMHEVETHVFLCGGHALFEDIQDVTFWVNILLMLGLHRSFSLIILYDSMLSTRTSLVIFRSCCST